MYIDGIVNYVEILDFIHLNYKIKKPETYRKLTMPNSLLLSHICYYSIPNIHRGQS